MFIWTALGQNTLRYVQLSPPSKKGVPPDREGSQPTYGPGERRASYVNMKSLAKGRLQMVRKDAEKKGSDILQNPAQAARIMAQFSNLKMFI